MEQMVYLSDTKATLAVGVNPGALSTLNDPNDLTVKLNDGIKSNTQLYNKSYFLT
jgi:hypothetical protein